MVELRLVKMKIMFFEVIGAVRLFHEWDSRPSYKQAESDAAQPLPVVRAAPARSSPTPAWSPLGQGRAAGRAQ